MANLMYELMKQIDRVKELVKLYEDLPDNAGIYGATVMKNNLAIADQAMKDGDLITMVQIYNELEGHE